MKVNLNEQENEDLKELDRALALEAGLSPRMIFVIDFDGTVAPEDTVDALLERFADPQWHEVEERWVLGEINSQQCMKAQLGMVRTGRSIIEDFLQNVAIDPWFAEFVRYVRPFAELAVVSDGLDYTIRHALEAMVPPIPIYANTLQFLHGSLGIAFPHEDLTCKVKSGVCKCGVARSVRGDRELPVILIGDGYSDRCIARSADHVFAKSSLRTFCEDERIPHTPFQTFRDVLTVMREWNTSEEENVPGRLNAASVNVR